VVSNAGLRILVDIRRAQMSRSPTEDLLNLR
jgi:hypothetical protein